MGLLVLSKTWTASVSVSFVMASRALPDLSASNLFVATSVGMELASCVDVVTKFARASFVATGSAVPDYLIEDHRPALQSAVHAVPGVLS